MWNFWTLFLYWMLHIDSFLYNTFLLYSKHFILHVSSPYLSALCPNQETFQRATPGSTIWLVDDLLYFPATQTYVFFSLSLPITHCSYVKNLPWGESLTLWSGQSVSYKERNSNHVTALTKSRVCVNSFYCEVNAIRQSRNVLSK